jgi:hypothetical protein
MQWHLSSRLDRMARGSKLTIPRTTFSHGTIDREQMYNQTRDIKVSGYQIAQAATRAALESGKEGRIPT